MNRVTACVITLNEEENLSRALASVVGIADEIVVVDSGSIDRTEAIAREHGAKFFTRSWTTYADQKNFATECSTSEWILSLDADEELSSALHTSLWNWKKHPPRESVYEMARRTFYLGAWIGHSGWYPDFQRRLYRRGAAEFSGLVHEALRFEGKPGRLAGDLLHYTVRSFAEHQANVERYSTLAAQQMFARGRRSWRGALWFGTPWTLFQNLVLRGGFLDGRRGALIAWMAARSVRKKYGKLGRLIVDAQTRGGPGNRPGSNS